MVAGLSRYGEDSYFEVGSRYVEYRDGADDQSGGWEDLYFDHYVPEGGVRRVRPPSRPNGYGLSFLSRQGRITL
jgi:hypothetical protein